MARIMELEQNAEKAKIRDTELSTRIVELERSAKESEKRFVKLEQKQLQNDKEKSNYIVSQSKDASQLN